MRYDARAAGNPRDVQQLYARDRAVREDRLQLHPGRDRRLSLWSGMRRHRIRRGRYPVDHPREPDRLLDHARHHCMLYHRGFDLRRNALSKRAEGKGYRYRKVRGADPVPPAAKHAGAVLFDGDAIPNAAALPCGGAYPLRRYRSTHHPAVEETAACSTAKAIIHRSRLLITGV